MNIAFIYLFHEGISAAIMCDEIQSKKKKQNKTQNSGNDFYFPSHGVTTKKYKLIIILHRDSFLCKISISTNPKLL